jgi:hypothetical protein
MAQAIGAKPPFKIPQALLPILQKIPIVGRKVNFFIKEREYSIKRIKSAGFRPFYDARESIVKSARARIDN